MQNRKSEEIDVIIPIIFLDDAILKFYELRNEYSLHMKATTAIKQLIL